MKISRDELLKIAQLAKLRLTKHEEQLFCRQVSDILTFISELKTADVGNARSVGQINGERNNWREDSIECCDMDIIAALLAAAPERKDDFIKVPSVFEET